MKKTTLLLTAILFTLSVQSQETFTKAYLNVILAHGKTIKHFDASVAFIFDLKANTLEYFPHEGQKEDYILLSEIQYGIDKYGDSYKITKSVSKKFGKIIYVQIYDNPDFGMNFLYEGGETLIHFYDKK